MHQAVRVWQTDYRLIRVETESWRQSSMSRPAVNKRICACLTLPCQGLESLRFSLSCYLPTNLLAERISINANMTDEYNSSDCACRKRQPSNDLVGRKEPNQYSTFIDQPLWPAVSQPNTRNN